MGPLPKRDTTPPVSLQGGIAGFALLVVLAIWLFTAWQLSSSREQMLHDRSVALQNLTLILAEHLAQVLDRASAPETTLSSKHTISLQSTLYGLPAALLVNLNDLYHSLELGRSGSIQIVTQRGDKLFRIEQNGQLTEDYLLERQNVLQSGHSQGEFRVEMADGHSYLSRFVKLDRYPLILVVGQSEVEILQPHREQRREYIATVLILTLLAVGGLGWLLWVLHRRETYMRALERSENRNLKLLNTLRSEHQHTLEAASRDHLTGLYNRRLFLELAYSHLLGSKRQGRFAAVCFIDLDRFKIINDTLGHKVGDLLLQEVAARLNSSLRESDIISRFGGDEFVVMLTEVRRHEDIETCVQHLVHVLSAPYAELEEAGLGTSPSIGVSVSPQDGVEIEMLVKNADTAMYQAKHAGRGQYAFYAPRQGSEQGGKPDLSLLSPNAMQQQLRVYYQPTISLRGYATTGFEALVRWECPGHGLIYPDSFLEVAEARGLMPELGRQVLEQVMQQLSQWRSQGLTLLPISVNLNLSQLQDPELVNWIAARLNQYGIAPGLIQIEINDRYLQHLGPVETRLLEALYGIGLELVIDDFGRSEIGLEYLRLEHVFFSWIKIERSFVQSIRNRYDDDVMLSSIVAMARKKRLKVAAKGVETPDQLVCLKLSGCDEVQGFFFSRALPSEEAVRYLISPQCQVPVMDRPEQVGAPSGVRLDPVVPPAV